MPPPTIAVVEDEPGILLFLDDLLTDEGSETILVMQGRDAPTILRRLQPDLVILDLRLEHPHAGAHVLGLLERDPQTCRIPVIICAAHPDARRYEVIWWQDKGYVLMPTPFDNDQLLAEISGLLSGAGNGTSGRRRSR